MKKNDQNILFHTLSDREKLYKAEDYMSQYGNRIARVNGMLKAYLEMKWCQIENDSENVKIKKEVLKDATETLEFCMNIYSHFLKDLLNNK